MKNTSLTTLTLISIGFCIGAPHLAHAAGQLNLALGQYDIRHNNDAANLHLEYRALNLNLLEKITPYIGIDITTEGSLWIGGGFLTDLKLDEKWTLTPSLGIGYYNKGSSDLDLNHPIEFKTGLELSYTLENNNRIGLNFTHLSNAGLGNTNPGTEILSLSYTFPFDTLF